MTSKMFPSPWFITVVIPFSIAIFISLLCFLPVIEATPDTLTANDSLSINQTLISAEGKFELGFFSQANSSKYYVGIWYKDIPANDTIVWVANRDAPSSTHSCTLQLLSDGNLFILENGSNILWSTNLSQVENPALQLLDSGNLVIHEADDENPDHYIWQSFDYPTDTLLPGQKIGWNLKIGLNRFLTSWKAADDPGLGQFSIKLDYRGDPEVYLWQGDDIIYRTGPWVGPWFSGAPAFQSSGSGFNFSFHSGSDEVYCTFQSPNSSAMKSRLMVSNDGFFIMYRWAPDTEQWIHFIMYREDQCDSYRTCGPYGVCNMSAPSPCQCPQGFRPKYPQASAQNDGTYGCIIDTNWECLSDKFLKLENMKLPETSTAVVDRHMNLSQCRDMCKMNCSCTAYANAQVVRQVGTGCVYWIADLTDMKWYDNAGQDLYIRLATSDSGNLAKRRHLRNYVLIAISTFAAIIMLCFLIWMHIKRSRSVTQAPSFKMDEIKDVASLQFDLESVKAATRNFSNDNKLGEGGFGEVYKGQLNDGQEIAVKRLSESSRQGIVEFKTEALLVAKLQHNNLVKLLGFCLGPKEKILIYEYLQNSSLDKFLSDPTKKKFFNWQVRVKVIVGIARGLMYLHEDSRLKIIHRDLKPSNILLDQNMNPKIADFGLAKLFTMDQTQDDTKRIVGTYGYMAPEYAVTGHFSVKSDVYSFGIIVLEIVTGQRNRFFGRSLHEEALLHRAWRLWNEGKAMELVDTSLGNDYPKEEVTMCIQIALLCIQESAIERPKMVTVVAALSGQSISLPSPKAPSFFGNTSATTEIRPFSGTERITDIYPR